MRRINSTRVLVRRADGKYLILRGSKWEERPDRSQKPDLPGGLVDAGETCEQGAIRELREEAGIQVQTSDLELVQGFSYIWKDQDAVTRLMYFVEVDMPEVTLSWEHEGYWWMDAKEVLALEIRPPYTETFEYLHKIGLLI